MAARIVKELQGFSGSRIYLMTKHGRLWIRKQGNITRNFDRYQALQGLLPMPEVYNIFDDTMDMEYIHGHDMRSYLLNYPVEPLLEFLTGILENLSLDAEPRDYRGRVEQFLDTVDHSPFQFDPKQIIDEVPDQLPQSQYHGDLTLENIIYSDTQGFYLIDAQTGIWDSYIFDICKLRQDLECGWFLRDQPAFVDNKLDWLQNAVLDVWPQANNRALLTLMLLRVYRYARPESTDHAFLIKVINNLWKS